MDKNIRKEIYRRVFNEKHALDIKLEKLRHFIKSDNFKNIEEEQKELLVRQLHAMDMYDSILEERLEYLSN
jgi:hypothetical protein